MLIRVSCQLFRERISLMRCCTFWEFGLPRTHHPFRVDGPSIHPDINSAPRTIWLFVMRAALICMRTACTHSDGSILAASPLAADSFHMQSERTLHEQYQNTGLIKAHYASAWNAKHPRSFARVLAADAAILIISFNRDFKCRWRIKRRCTRS